MAKGLLAALRAVPEADRAETCGFAYRACQKAGKRGLAAAVIAAFPEEVISQTCERVPAGPQERRIRIVRD